MGTRHLIAVFYQGEYRIAQYGQWDGYPDGQGIDILKFLRERKSSPTFENKLLKLRDMTQEDAAKIDAMSNWQKSYPQLSRDAGSDILDLVQTGEDGMIVKRGIDFAGDSLFCEWAYVIDLDKNTFEAFRGFNKSKLDASERFASAPKDKPDSEYEPVKFVKAWPLSALPTNEEFLATFKDPGNEEEEAA